MKTLKDYLAETIRRYGAVGSSPGMGYTVEDAAVKYGVFAKGGSVGSQRFRDDPLKTFDSKEEAIADARRRRSGLSKGERGYYRMSYIVKPIKGVAEGSAGNQLKAIDGDYYEDSTDFFSMFDQDHFDREEDSEDGMEIRGYIDDHCVMVFKFSTPDMMGGWGNYDDSALIAESGVEDDDEDDPFTPSGKMNDWDYDVENPLRKNNDEEDEGETCPECDGAGCPECYGDEDRDRAHDHAQGMERESAGMAEAGRPDVMRHRGDTTVKVVKRAGKPIGEIGIDAEASEGNGQYYVKLYDGSYDAVGFDTAAEALAELKYAISSSMKEDAASNDPLLAKSVDLAAVSALEENAELRLILQRAKLIE